MIQRKFSHSLLSLLFSRYYKNDIINEKSLEKIIELLPYNERFLVKKYNFDYLVKNIWTWQDSIVLNDINNKYVSFEEKYLYFKKTYLYLLDTIEIKFYEPDWEFPKGKRIYGETNTSCAKREFTEESNIELDNDVFFNENYLFKEFFFGTNNIEYCNNYYVTDIQNYPNAQNKSVYFEYNNKNQISEIRKIGWFSIEQIIEKIKHHQHKLNLIKSVDNFILNKKQSICLKNLQDLQKLNLKDLK